jgi:hypothetical protein
MGVAEQEFRIYTPFKQTYHMDYLKRQRERRVGQKELLTTCRTNKIVVVAGRPERRVNMSCDRSFESSLGTSPGTPLHSFLMLGVLPTRVMMTDSCIGSM